MATKRLTNLDGNLSQGTVGVEIIGDGSTAIPADGYYLVTAVAGSTTLPTGIEVGYMVYLTTSNTPATGDNVKPVTLTPMCFVQNGSLSFSRDVLEVTTLCDSVKTYKSGFTDLSGSFDGITEAGNDSVKDIINKFVDTVTLDAAGSTATVSEANTNIFYLQFEVNKASTQNEPLQFYFLPVTLTTGDTGLANASAQTFSTAFQTTSDDVNGIKPAFYDREVV